MYVVFQLYYYGRKRKLNFRIPALGLEWGENEWKKEVENNPKQLSFIPFFHHLFLFFRFVLLWFIPGRMDIVIFFLLPLLFL